MAKDVITRFKLETTAFDSKIKQAAKGLSDYSKTATQAGSEFNKFTQKNVEAARALGTMATSSNNAKGKVQELVGAYNELAKAYEHLTDEQKQSDFAKAMAQSLTQLQQRIKDTKQELYGLGSAVEQVKSKGGLFGDGGLTGMLQVTGGNLLAQGITQLGAEIADTIKQGVELARQGEGVRMAFERLNKPGLLDNLKEATHGTVSELELMKAAVKFDDFKLPVEQLGTLLAFAQKKAKDTGQSVDYMVDSIVTGLGRKSLMILDNLGLSAAQIKEEMAKTGDMTSAVSKIIKEQMAEAGEYVETAADRAARSAADATNEMERLGREAQPFAEEWAKAWNEIKIGGMSVLTTVFGPLAESARQIRQILNGEGFKFKAGIPNLADGPAPSPTRKPGTDHKVTAPGGYVEITDKNTGAVIGGQHFDNLQDTNAINAWRKSLSKTTSNKGGKTPAQQAQEKVAQALHDYQQSIEMAQMEMKSGAITEADAKKKELQAQQRLWDAYGDAYNIYKNPKYKEAQDKAAVEIVKLGGEVKTSVEAQKKAQEAARQLEQAQKKLADAQTKLAEAKATGDLKQVYTAQKAVDTAQADVTRLTQKVDIVPGNVKAVTVPITYTSGNLDAFTAKLKEVLSKADVGSELQKNLTAQLADANTLGNLMQTAIMNGIDIAKFNPQELWSKVFGENPGDYIEDSQWQKLVDKINEILKDKGIQISLDTTTGTVSNKKGKSNPYLSRDENGKTTAKLTDVMGGLTGGISNIASNLESLGVELPQGMKDIFGGVQSMISILTSISTIVSAIEAISAADTLIPFAGGGIIKAAGGTLVGNSYSGDNLRGIDQNGQLYGLNAGEVVLNKAQTQSLASQLSGSGLQNMHLTGSLQGEDILVSINRVGRRKGLGEVCFFKE